MPASSHIRRREGRRSPQAVEALNQALAARFGNKLVTSEAVRIQHGHTLTWVANAPPDAVVFVSDTDDVVDVVRLCAEHDAPIIPFGAGTSLEGHVNALHGGVSIDMSRMDRLLTVHAEDLDCVVEPGLHRVALNEQLRDTGLFFPIDPGADASIGGMAATRASGTNAVRYGTMKDNVLSLVAVTADGSIVRTGGRAKKSSSGYDLTRLFVGSEVRWALLPRSPCGSTASPKRCPRVIARSRMFAPPATQRLQPSSRACRWRELNCWMLSRSGHATSIPNFPFPRRRCCLSSFMERRPALPSSRSVSERSPLSSAAAPSHGRRALKSARGCGRRDTTSIGRR